MYSPTGKIKNMSKMTPRQTMRGHTKRICDVTHLPSGRRIITCSEDGSIRLWDLECGTQIGEDWRDEADDAGVFAIALSPNGKTVASGSSDGTVRLWDVERPKVIAKWTGHSEGVKSLCWSADGNRLLSASYDGTTVAWNVTETQIGEIVLGPIKTGHDIVYEAKYSPDTTKIATCGRNENGVKIWEANTGELLSTLKHHDWVYSLAWTSDHKKLISATFVGSVRIYDTATWKQIAILNGHEVRPIRVSVNNHLLASTSWDNTARLWNLDIGVPVGLPLQHEARVNGAAFSADGTLLVTSCDDTNAYVWDVHTILKDAGLEDLLSVPVVTTGKSLMDTNTAPRGVQLEHDRRLPRGSFDHAQDGGHSSVTSGYTRRRHALSPYSASRPHAILGRFFSLFHRVQPNTDESMELPHKPSPSKSQRSLHSVEVAAVQDRQSLYVARRSERVSDQARRIQNHTWWSRCILFICCLPIGNTDGAQDPSGHK